MSLFLIFCSAFIFVMFLNEFYSGFSFLLNSSWRPFLPYINYVTCFVDLTLAFHSRTLSFLRSGKLLEKKKTIKEEKRESRPLARMLLNFILVISVL